MAKVKFMPVDKTVEANVGDSLLKISKNNDIGILYSCDGAPSCAMCRVSIVSGDENLSSIERKEEDLIGTSYFITKNRLSCQAKIVADGEVEVDITEHLERKETKKVVKKPQPKRDNRKPNQSQGNKNNPNHKNKKRNFRKKKGKGSEGQSQGQNQQTPKEDSSS